MATGRPTDVESERRQRVMVGLLAGGTSFKEAISLSRVKGDTLARLLDEPDFGPFAATILAERHGLAA